MTYEGNSASVRISMLESVRVEGFRILDLPELARESGLLTHEQLMILRKGSSALREREYEDASSFRLFDAINTGLGGVTAREVVLRCHRIFDAELSACHIVGPFAERGIIEALARRFELEHRPEDESVYAGPDSGLCQIYRDFLCFARPRERAEASVQIVTCALDVLHRRSEIEAAIGSSILIELTSVDRVVSAWRASGVIELLEDANVLARSVTVLKVLQPSSIEGATHGVVKDMRDMRLAKPRAVPYFSAGHESTGYLSAVSWAWVFERMNGKIGFRSEDQSQDVEFEELGNLRVDDDSSQDFKLTVLVHRVIQDCASSGAEWITLTVEPAHVALRAGGAGWCKLWDSFPRAMLGSLHALLCRVFDVAPEIGGNGRFDFSLDEAHHATVVAWLAPKRALLRGSSASQMLVQIRLIPIDRRQDRGSNPAIESIVAAARDSRVPRIVLVSSESEGTVSDICRRLCQHRPFSSLALMELGNPSRARGSSRASESEFGDQRLDDLRTCEPVAPSIIAIGDVRRSIEAEEVLRIALGGSYVVLRVPVTDIELATEFFLSSVAHRSSAAALLLAAVRVTHYNHCGLRFQAGFEGEMIPAFESMQSFVVLNFKSELREMLAHRWSQGQIGRGVSVVEFMEQISP